MAAPPTRSGVALPGGGVGWELESFPATLRPWPAEPRLTKAIIKHFHPAGFLTVPWRGAAGGGGELCPPSPAWGWKLLVDLGEARCQSQSCSRRRGAKGPEWAWAAGTGGSPVASPSSRVEELHLCNLESGISIPKARQGSNRETQVLVPVLPCVTLGKSLFSDSVLGW